jgi:poly(A) polymerase
MALMRAASGDSGGLAGVEDEITRGTAAEFPLRATDLIEAGMQPGPGLGDALKAARTRWLDSNFSMDKRELLDEITQKGHKY